MIELRYYGGGATAPSGIRIKESNSNLVFDDWRGINYKYTFVFSQINDTLLKLTITDTAYFKGTKFDRFVNLNKRKLSD
jgi:hypothetical protein